jgi:hypothetical protein
MTVVPLPRTGNSAKFMVNTKRGEFIIALSFTLRTKVWELADEAAELSAAKELAEAIVSRHDPALPFQSLYIFAEHNTEPTFEQALMRLRKHGFRG